MFRYVLILGTVIASSSISYAGNTCEDGSQVTVVGQVAEAFKNKGGKYTMTARTTSPCYIFFVITSFAPPNECSKFNNWFIASGTYREDTVVGALSSVDADKVSCQPDEPAQGATPKALPSIASDRGRWFVIVGAWPPADTAKVRSRLSQLSNKGIEGRTINTNDYPNLTPGLRAVVLGPFSKENAQDRLQDVISIVPDAFIKEGS